MRVEIPVDFREILQPASFRGIPFKVKAAEVAVGRSVVVHRFPFRRPFGEDLGQDTTEIIVDGFIIGDEYLNGRNKLIKALLQPGAGTLVHPTYGYLDVKLVDKTRLREQFIEQRGMVSFSLKFIEDNDEDELLSQVDTQLAVDAACDAAYASLESDFADNFSIKGMPGWSIESITSEIKAAADAISDLRQRISFNLTGLSSLVLAGEQFKSSLIGLLATPNALATELGSLVRGVVNLFDFSAAQQSVFGESSAVRRPINQLLGFTSYGATRPTIAATTPVRSQQAANQAALFTLLARAAVIEATRASTFEVFSSKDDAVELRDTLYAALEEQILAASDTVYRPLLDVRAAMVQDITDRGADLAILVATTLTASMPAPVLSYRLYRDVVYADELVERNQASAELIHPLFLPASVPLEVRRV